MSTRVARPDTPLRKAPRQARSRATVDVIVTAGARVLAEQGWARFSTNQVAARAGVSIGSLYQYFPDKHAIVAAIRQRHVEDVLQAIRAASAAGLAPRDRAERLVDGLVQAHTRQPGLHRVLLDVAPRGARPGDADFERAYLAAYAAVIRAARDRTTPAAAQVAARVLAGAVEGAIHLGARSHALASSRWRQELVHLVAVAAAGGPLAA